MITARSLWEQWRTSTRLTPRFTLKRRFPQPTVGNDNDCDHSQEMQEQAHVPSHGDVNIETPSSLGQQNAHHQPHPPIASLQYPMSPVPNETQHSLSAETITTTPQPMQHFASSQETYEQDIAMYSLTPPASSPFPTIVSAKRWATEIRSKHHKKRRRGRKYRTFLQDQTNTGETNIDSKQQVKSSYDALSTDDDEIDSATQSWNIETAALCPQERNHYFWKICYGTATPPSITALESSWSAQRFPPTKSCLSSRKKYRRAHSLPICMASNHASPTLLPRSATERQSKQRTPTMSGKKSVQFGALSAAEFERDEPPSSAMKHLPADDARLRFHCPLQESQNDDAEQDMNTDTERTKANSRILAEWESDFGCSSKQENENAAKRRRRSSGTFQPLWMPSTEPNFHDNDDDMDADDDNPTSLQGDYINEK